MRELHLFAGAGGGILGGMLLGHTPVAAVEIDSYCREVLKARQADGFLPPFPVFHSVKEEAEQRELWHDPGMFAPRDWRGKVDVICGGFPCQPWSTAGHHAGADDPRHLWPEMARIVQEIRPSYVFAENVSIQAFAEPWRDLRAMGYRVPPAICVAASDVGAPHLRKRWWLLAADADGQQLRNDKQRCEAGWNDLQDCRGADDPHPHSQLPHGTERREQAGRAKPAKLCSQPAADASGSGLEEREGSKAERAFRAAARGDWWAAEPGMGRVANGVASRVDRLHAIGNGQVPLAAATAWRILMGQL